MKSMKAYHVVDAGLAIPEDVVFNGLIIKHN